MSDATVISPGNPMKGSVAPVANDVDVNGVLIQEETGNFLLVLQQGQHKSCPTDLILAVQINLSLKNNPPDSIKVARTT